MPRIHSTPIVLHDDLLYVIGQLLHHDWINLAHNLDCNDIRDSLISRSTTSPSIPALLMLQAWIAKGFNVNTHFLSKNLVRCGRTDLAENVMLWSRGDEVTNETISKLSTNICTVWERLAIYMGFTFTQIENYKEANKVETLCPGYELLKMWRLKVGYCNDEAIIEKLVAAFSKINRMDLVMMLYKI